ncbi:MAG: isoprenylcysteine carboxylmethyltransferase family protein [Bacteroidales bacterium]|nr:isoprenylcysteine carboxylmethyltransferase family protein [Bacteroidales bacterium]
MKNKLILKVVVLYPVFMCILFFLPAGSFKFWEAWIYSVTLFIPMMTTLIYLVNKDPALLERRFKRKEKEIKQKIIVKIFTIPFFIGFIIPGFDYRFNWSDVPIFLVVIANIIVFLSYFFVFLVFKENSYASRVVEVEKNQKIISTGPYAIVRHPMYTGMTFLFLFTPIALGSYWALTMFVFLPIVFIFRILNEENVLRKDLSGYIEYCQKTRYRLIPYIW